VLVDKFAAEVAATEEHIWFAQEGWVGDVAVESGGLVGTCEEPDLDEAVGPLRDIVTTIDTVEPDTAATSVCDVSAVRQGVAVSGANGTKVAAALVGDGASASAAMQGCLVLGHLVHAFDDVYAELVGHRTNLWGHAIPISPSFGQVSPKDQNAGQEPHALPGMCWISATKMPLLYLVVPSRRTDGRPELVVATDEVLSARKTTELPRVWIRPDNEAASSVW
jgi:hypothetical protein